MRDKKYQLKRITSRYRVGGSSGAIEIFTQLCTMWTESGSQWLSGS